MASFTFSFHHRITSFITLLHSSHHTVSCRGEHGTHFSSSACSQQQCHISTLFTAGPCFALPTPACISTASSHGHQPIIAPASSWVHCHTLPTIHKQGGLGRHCHTLSLTAWGSSHQVHHSSKPAGTSSLAAGHSHTGSSSSSQHMPHAPQPSSSIGLPPILRHWPHTLHPPQGQAGQSRQHSSPSTSKPGGSFSHTTPHFQATSQQGFPTLGIPHQGLFSQARATIGQAGQFFNQTFFLAIGHWGPGHTGFFNPFHSFHFPHTTGHWGTSHWFQAFTTQPSSWAIICQGSFIQGKATPQNFNILGKGRAPTTTSFFFSQTHGGSPRVLGPSQGHSSRADHYILGYGGVTHGGTGNLFTPPRVVYLQGP